MGVSLLPISPPRTPLPAPSSPLFSKPMALHDTSAFTRTQVLFGIMPNEMAKSLRAKTSLARSGLKILPHPMQRHRQGGGRSLGIGPTCWSYDLLTFRALS